MKSFPYCSQCSNKETCHGKKSVEGSPGNIMETILKMISEGGEGQGDNSSKPTFKFHLLDMEEVEPKAITTEDFTSIQKQYLAMKNMVKMQQEELNAKTRALSALADDLEEMVEDMATLEYKTDVVINLLIEDDMRKDLARVIMAL